MRVDRRRTDQLRPVKLEIGYTRWAEGSVLVTQGETVVLCNATIDEQLPPWMLRAREERGWVTAEYAMLPRSTLTRTPRETTPQPRTQEIRRLIGRSLRAAVNLELLGKRQIIVDCDVLQADGGTRTASITGAYVALYRALQRMLAERRIEEMPIRWAVAAISVGVVGEDVLLDLTYGEDAVAEVDLNVVMTDQGRFVELQGTAEGEPFSHARLDEMLRVAQQGVEELFRVQRAALGLS